ncbi:MAG: hypothetical protein D3916_16420, partial [Candidatus Electrothrix sp. MAN1_4]|nr:hypothetical protein [Candidatus Electrothrix sp. MAN1_4]
QERMYAAGRIPGNYFRREIGRPSEKEILTCRLIDRPLRPLFPKGYMSETQLITTVFSADQEVDPDILAMNGASAALVLSDVPWAGPVAAARVGYINNEYILNPTASQLAKSAMNLVVAGTETAVVMVEGRTGELSEDVVLEAIFFAHQEIQPIIAMQKALQEEAGKEKREVAPPAINEALKAKVEEAATAGMDPLGIMGGQFAPRPWGNRPILQREGRIRHNELLGNLCEFFFKQFRCAGKYCRPN